MKFPSEGEFWNCHFAGYKMGASNQMFQAKLESENKKISKVRHSVPTTVYLCLLLNQTRPRFGDPPSRGGFRVAWSHLKEQIDIRRFKNLV